MYPSHDPITAQLFLSLVLQNKSLKQEFFGVIIVGGVLSGEEEWGT